MRSINNEFSSMLLKIGSGELNPFIPPQKWITTDVCESIFGDINEKKFLNKVILTPKNKDVHKLN